MGDIIGIGPRLIKPNVNYAQVGAGIQVPPNSSRILIKWGLRNAFERDAVNPHSFILRGKEGGVLSTQPMVPYVEDEYGAPYWHIHRADFHAHMVEKAQSLGVDIRLGARVDAIDFDTPVVYLAGSGDGKEDEEDRRIKCDVVVAADGLKSRCRELLVGHADPPHDTGDLAYRILVRAENMRRDPLLAPLAATPHINYWMGPDCHAVCYLLKGGGLYNIVLIAPDNLPRDGPSTAPADLAEMHALFDGWDPALRRLLTLTEATAKWRLQNSREMPAWVHAAGRFTLLGDACHATLPYLAQGAAMAVEDGAVLGGLLAKVDARRKGELLPRVLNAYEATRKKRTTAVVQGSTALRDVFHMHDGPERDRRDAELLKDQPTEGFPNRWRDPVFQKFLFGYDAFAEVEKAWSRIDGARL